MAKRLPKISKGVYKTELSNEPIRFQVTPGEKNLIIKQAQEREKTQSEYLRYLLLQAPQRETQAQNTNSKSLFNLVKQIGNRLNKIAKQINKQCLAQETISISSEETIFKEIIEILKLVASKTKQLRQTRLETRNISVKVLVNKTQLKDIEQKVKAKKLTISKYLRQQITGYEETNYKSKIKEFVGQLGRLANNINQIFQVIITQERNNRLVIIDSTTKFTIQHCYDKVNNLKKQILNYES